MQRGTQKQMQERYSRFTPNRSIAYPTLNHVAQARIEDLQDRIKPLGLVKRAGFIRKTAEIIMNQYDGVIPKVKERLLEMPGIGEYTANSIVC